MQNKLPTRDRCSVNTMIRSIFANDHELNWSSRDGRCHQDISRISAIVGYWRPWASTVYTEENTPEWGTIGVLGGTRRTRPRVAYLWGIRTTSTGIPINNNITCELSYAPLSVKAGFLLAHERERDNNASAVDLRFPTAGTDDD